METIINYFDHIFLVLPPTAEVQKAKEERYVERSPGQRKYSGYETIRT